MQAACRLHFQTPQKGWRQPIYIPRPRDRRGMTDIITPQRRCSGHTDKLYTLGPSHGYEVVLNIPTGKVEYKTTAGRYRHRKQDSRCRAAFGEARGARSPMKK
jgi:hypothetical protein